MRGYSGARSLVALTLTLWRSLDSARTLALGTLCWFITSEARPAMPTPSGPFWSIRKAISFCQISHLRLFRSSTVRQRKASKGAETAAPTGAQVPLTSYTHDRPHPPGEGHTSRPFNPYNLRASYRNLTRRGVRNRPYKSLPNTHAHTHTHIHTHTRGQIF